ncbi:MAG: GntR family transcriptional regulator [Candidatus Gastranaerophilales bacterium]|nr:GntR family transcriptional regulator [Candidatus Gastranaerophilales bacterium]
MCRLIMKDANNFLLLDKSSLKKLDIKDISIAPPDLKNVFEPKAVVISQWLIDWIKADFTAGKIKETDLMPSKTELAYYLGISIGTMQNAFRYVEDKGYVESKQCIGTMIRDWRKPTSAMRKLTSKRDICTDLIKKYVIENKIKIGQKIPSSRILAELIGFSSNTTRLALEKLCLSGILERKFISSNETGWVLKSNDFILTKENLNISNNITLVRKIENDLENYIKKNLKIGDKLPAHEDLATEFKVSIKTIHDALKTLIKKEILLPRRGRYGTTVIRMPGEEAISSKKETSIFASAQETAFYNYEKTQNHIKLLIAQNYEIGSKLPSIKVLSTELDLSPNTIRKALNNLAKDGYLRFARGRWGGTFVVDIPETSSQSFKWLAVNPKYVEVYR